MTVFHSVRSCGTLFTIHPSLTLSDFVYPCIAPFEQFDLIDPIDPFNRLDMFDPFDPFDHFDPLNPFDLFEPIWHGLTH